MTTNDFKPPPPRPKARPTPKKQVVNIERKPKMNIHKSNSKIDKKTVLLTLVLLLSVFTTAFFAYKYYQIQKDPGSQLEQKNSSETKEVIDALGKIIALPVDKQPTVAKVEDVEALKKTNQTFYKDVAKDDYLVLYTDRAIIFRKQDNKVINVAPIVDSSKLKTTEESDASD